MLVIINYVFGYVEMVYKIYSKVTKASLGTTSAYLSGHNAQPRSDRGQLSLSKHSHFIHIKFFDTHSLNLAIFQIMCDERETIEEFLHLIVCDCEL